MFEAVIAVPLAVTWMLVTAHFSLESFVVGFAVGLAIMVLLKSNSPAMQARRLPDQVWAFGIYTLTLCRDIWYATWDVTKRVLNPAMPMKPGIISVATEDENDSEVVAAFSAHGITITPGELVVDFDGKHTMFVHCLDVEASSQSAPGAQAARLKLLNRILGR
jgi:multicomponent Na+:H+ antiporter subunit E